MDYSLISDLLSAFESLNKANTAFQQATQADQDHPVWLPTPFDSARETAIRATTQLWHDDDEDLPFSGLLCACPATIACASKLNSTKAAFQRAVRAIKEASGTKKTKLSRILEKTLTTSPIRDTELAKALEAARISRLNLIWCYRQVLVLPPHLESVSWTWAKKHREISRITLEEAREIADAMPDVYTRDIALSILSKEDPAKPLAYVKPIKPQLRANVVWTEQGERKRKLVVTPTVILAQDNYLPRLHWPVSPENTPPRLDRSDVSVDNEPLVKALSLHRYLPDR